MHNTVSLIEQEWTITDETKIKICFSIPHSSPFDSEEFCFKIKQHNMNQIQKKKSLSKFSAKFANSGLNLWWMSIEINISEGNPVSLKLYL